MKLEIHKVNQMSSSASFVVIYDATMAFTGNEVSIMIASVNPANADAQLIERAAYSIVKGARRALEPTRKGAHIDVERLVIHPDFKEWAFELFTFEEVTRLASIEGEPDGEGHPTNRSVLK